MDTNTEITGYSMEVSDWENICEPSISGGFNGTLW